MLFLGASLTRFAAGVVNFIRGREGARKQRFLKLLITVLRVTQVWKEDRVFLLKARITVDSVYGKVSI